MNTANMLLSVIVPVYNVEKYLGQCVESILGQTYPHLEVILVDDGSTDGSGKLCDAYAAQDPRVKVVHQLNKGLSGARNSGLPLATGEYIVYVDSDDWLEADALEQCVRSLVEHSQPDILMYGYYRATSRDKQACVLSTSPTSPQEAVMGIVDTVRFIPSVWSRIFKRSLVEDLVFMEGRVYEDVPYSLHAHLLAKSFVYLPLPLYNYRANEQSISFTMKENIIDLFLNLQDLLYRIKDSHPEWVPLVNATRIRWLQAHYDEICERNLRPERFAPIFADMRKFPFSYANRKNYWARWFFIRFPQLYTHIKHFRH